MSHPETLQLENLNEKKADVAVAKKFKFMGDKRQREMLAERVMDLVGQVQHDRVNNLVFLDKSARPLNTLFIELWKRANPGEIYPRINFFNIGKETSAAAAKTLQSYGDIKPDQLSPEDMERIIGTEEIARVRKEYTYLEKASPDHPVLLVEEYTNTGESLAWAQNILKTIFPNLKFETFSLAQQVSRFDRKPGELGLFEVWTDPVTKDSTTFNPPWRVNEKSGQYGVTGVVDNEGSLTAKSTHKMMTPEERETKYRENLALYEKHFKETLPKTLAEQITEINNEFVNPGSPIPSLDTVEWDPPVEADIKNTAETEIKELIKAIGFEQYWTTISTLASEFSKAASENKWDEAADLAKRVDAMTKDQGIQIRTAFDSRVRAFIQENRNTRNTPDAKDPALFGAIRNIQEDFQYKKLFSVVGIGENDAPVLTNLKRVLDTHEKIERGAKPIYAPEVAELRGEMRAIADEYWETKQSKVN